jgi:hypothetical protein
MAINFATLFSRMGRFFYIGESINTTLGSTVPTRVNAAIAGLGASLPVDYEGVRDSLLGGLTAIQQAGGSGNNALIQQAIQELIIQTVLDDVPHASALDSAMVELIRQATEQSQTVDGSTVGSSIAYDSANTGNGVALLSTKRVDGTNCLFAFAEDIEAIVSSTENDEALFDAIGAPAVDTLLPTWPGGSGTAAQIVGQTASSADNLVSNGTFEESDDNSAHLPLGWLAPTATLGTTLKMGSVEIQTVVISGTPTAGFYTISWANAAGQTQTTAPLSFEASESDVQTALRTLVGLEEIEVATTGTSPNYTHTVTLYGVTNPAQFTSTSAMTGGVPLITHNTTTAGSSHVMRGARSVEFDSDGSQLTTILVPIPLASLSQYAFCAFMKVDSVPAAGIMTIDLVDGIGGTVLADDEGNSNTLAVAATGLTTTFVAQTAVFRTPAAMPNQAYLRIRISTAVTNTSSVFIDEVQLVPMTELYTDGPSVAVFDGSTAWLEDDIITFTITNDRAGLLHEWLDRLLALRENRQQFPVATDGSETITDSLVAAYSEDLLLAEDDQELLTEDGETLVVES